MLGTELPRLRHRSLYWLSNLNQLAFRSLRQQSLHCTCVREEDSVNQGRLKTFHCPVPQFSTHFLEWLGQLHKYGWKSDLLMSLPTACKVDLAGGRDRIEGEGKGLKYSDWVGTRIHLAFKGNNSMFQDI